MAGFLMNKYAINLFNGLQKVITRQVLQVEKRDFHKAMTLRNQQKPLNPQFELYTADKFLNPIKPITNDPTSRPLVVLIAWMLAKKKHIEKYSEIYLKQGFDVLSVTMTPWQFLWPTTGAQPIADELLQYLNEHSNRPLLLHGFSVGAYLWGEVLVKINTDLPKYTKLIDRVKGQIWDSAPDIAELHKGIPRALVPGNSLLRATVEKYVVYHLSTFQNSVTQHYIRSSQLFHTTPIRAPTLLFISKNDLIATEASNQRVRKSWESLGMKVSWKCWDKSKHVSHFILHRDEYLYELNSFIASLDLFSQYEEVKDKIKAKL
ncbi:transmembrane protein 53-A-like [Cimex lectularius]|uniref:Uncharacterized protein n=1 Tax=Cimex lectularius TaxID=79782 RepID=A0A8I6S4J1_CIMLE|nr:transmembrane protein 53-A-like [Cimex lectularius]